MKSVAKTKDSDFKLISTQTKRRISGLIEMKLTPQTIALFANEYEDYNPEIRLEIVEYIGFLMEQELSIFMAQVTNKSLDTVDIRRRQQAFEEKARNIRKIQDILVDPKSVKSSSSEKTKKDVDKIVSKEKTVKNESISKIDQLIKEAELREKNNARLEKERQAKLKKELELQKKEKKHTDKKVEKVKKEKNDSKSTRDNSEAAILAKTKAENEAFLKRQREIQLEKEKQAKEYAKREAEKEKLWMELYGKSREESQKHREQSNDSKNSNKSDDRDKTPHIKDIKISFYSLFGQTYPIEELIDPKNRVYLFWFNIKQKYSAGNLFAFIESLPLAKQKKLFKKRIKWMKKFSHLNSQQSESADQKVEIKNQDSKKVEDKNKKDKKVEDKKVEDKKVEDKKVEDKKVEDKK